MDSGPGSHNMGGPILLQFITEYAFYRRTSFNTTDVREEKERGLWDALLSCCSHGLFIPPKSFKSQVYVRQKSYPLLKPLLTGLCCVDCVSERLVKFAYINVLILNWAILDLPNAGIMPSFE